MMWWRGDYIISRCEQQQQQQNQQQQHQLGMQTRANNRRIHARVEQQSCATCWKNKQVDTGNAVKPESRSELLAQIRQQKERKNAYNGNFICHNMRVGCECDKKGVSVQRRRMKNDREKIENINRATHTVLQRQSQKRLKVNRVAGKRGNDMRRKQRHLCLLQWCCCHFFLCSANLFSRSNFIFFRYFGWINEPIHTPSTIDDGVRVSSNISRMNGSLTTAARTAYAQTI